MNIINRVKSIDARINYLCAEIRHIESRLEYSGIVYSEIKSKNDKSKLEKNMIKLVECHEELDELIIQETETRRRLMAIVSVLPNYQFVEIVNYIVNDKMTVNKVAEITGYTPRTISRQMEKINEIIDKKENDEEFMKLVDLSISEGKSLWDMLIDFGYDTSSIM